jgi:DNA-directed RNA polymerase subunit K/omega
MIYPTSDELTQGRFNRYELVIGIAKSARLVTDEYVAQRTAAQKLIDDRQTEQTLAQLIAPEYRDQKAVKIAIARMASGEYRMTRRPQED